MSGKLVPIVSDDIESLSWYHPNATRHIAESLLMQNGKEGSYLLRPSSQDKELAMSIRCKDSVKHFNVLWDGHQYTFGLASFASMDEFVIHFQKQPFIAGESGLITWLKYPYPREVSEPSVYDKVRIHAQYGENRSVRGNPTVSIGSKEGFMTKLGGIVKNWKNRWFVLKRNELSYFRKQTDTQAIRTLDISECKLCEKDFTHGRPNCFRLEFGWRTFYFMCDTEAEMKEWMDIILWKLSQKNPSQTC